MQGDFMRDYQNYQKEGRREDLINFARKGLPTPRGPKVNKAQKRWERSEYNKWIGWTLVIILPIITIISSKKLGLEYEIIGYPMFTIWILFMIHTSIEHKNAYLALEKANGRCHLEAEEEYEQKYGSNYGD